MQNIPSTRTFVLHDGALGDVLLSLPCLRMIRANSASFHFTGRTDVAGFLKKIGFASDASPSDHSVCASFYSDLDEPARQFLSRFSRFFIFTTMTDSPVLTNVATFIPDAHVIATVPPEGIRIPVADFRLSQLGRLSLAADRPAVLDIPPSHRGNTLSWLEAHGFGPDRFLIAIHPGSGGSKKCWPLERYFSLADSMRQSVGPRFLFFSGPAEHGCVKREIGRYAAGNDDVLHVQDYPLVQAASLLSYCALYIGNDSGFTHLAAALGLAVIALFGPTDPLLWGPVGQLVQTISTGWPSGIDSIEVSAVYGKAVSLLNARGDPHP